MDIFRYLAEQISIAVYPYMPYLLTYILPIGALWITVLQLRESRVQTKLQKTDKNQTHTYCSNFPDDCTDIDHGKCQEITPFQSFKDFDESWCPELIIIPAGSFLMGSMEGEYGRFDDETPQHAVKITKQFAVSKFPITFEQYDYFCAETKRKLPSDEGWGRSDRPVINVSWEDAQAYVYWLSKKTKAVYQLPTEAEWEYVCRAGTLTQYSFGDSLSLKHANYSSSEIPSTSKVGSYDKNAWGVYDLHGNIWEWCLDGKRAYRSLEEINPVGPTGVKDYRITRGGAWSVSPRYLRSAFRHSDPPTYRDNDIGFRCVRMLGSKICTSKQAIHLTILQRMQAIAKKYVK